MSKIPTMSGRTKMSIFALVAALELSASAITTPTQSNAAPRVATSRSESAAPPNPAAILASARLIYVYSRTGFVKSEVIESELQKRRELQQAGLFITADPNAADLRMEVRRSNFTTEYPYVVIDMKTRIVVASGKVNSLFGTAASKIARGFAKQLKQAQTGITANK